LRAKQFASRPTFKAGSAKLPAARAKHFAPLARLPISASEAFCFVHEPFHFVRDPFCFVHDPFCFASEPFCSAHEPFYFALRQDNLNNQRDLRTNKPPPPEAGHTGLALIPGVSGRIVERIERHLQEKGIVIRPSGGFNHYTVASNFASHPPAKLDADTLKRFEAMFVAVNALYS